MVTVTTEIEMPVNEKAKLRNNRAISQTTHIGAGCEICGGKVDESTFARGKVAVFRTGTWRALERSGA